MSFYHPRHLGVRERTSTVRHPEAWSRAGHYEVWREGIDAARNYYAVFTDEQILREVQGAPSNRFTLLLGEPGIGKTSLLNEWFRRTALAALRDSFLGMVVPVRVVLRSHQDVLQKERGARLADTLWEACASEWLTIDAPSEQRRFIEEMYSDGSGRFFAPLWLLDGLDELPSSISHSDDFYQRIISLPGCKVITSRTAVFPSLREVADRYKAREYEILGFRPDEQLRFLRSAIPQSGALATYPYSQADEIFNQIQRSMAVRLLAGSPLMLALIAEIAGVSGKIELPQSRAEFYKQAIERFWYRKLSADEEALRLRCERDEFLLGKVDEMGLASLQARFNATGALERGLRRSGLLRVDDETGSMEFVHLTFQEYYLAKLLAQIGLQRALQEHWQDPRYEETLGLVVSLLAEKGNFDEIELGTRWLLEWSRHVHETAPQTLWEIGRSPLRTVFHILGRSGLVSDNDAGSRFSSLLRDVVRCSNFRRRSVARGGLINV